MYRVRFYKDRNGHQPAVEYLRTLKARNDKDARIRARKIQDYINILQEHGTYIGEPVCKHIEDDIWELRPARDRVFFVAWHNNGYVILHAFEKHGNKTPEREKEQARREYKDLQERGLEDD